MSRSKKESFCRRRAFVMIGVHLLGVAGVVYLYLQPSWSITLLAIAYFFVFHLSTTVGAHRYFTHQAFTATPVFAYSLAVLHAGTGQSNLLWWCSKHYQHHANEDKCGLDPHTPNDGFWHAHMLWLLKRSGYGPTKKKYLKPYLNQNKLRNRVIRWQKKHYGWLVGLWLIIVPGLIGLIVGDVVGGILVIGFSRLVVQYHTTWFVNSAGHKWGERLNERSSARNIGWRATAFLFGLLTVGESHHANHHREAANWRLGWRWWQLDPGAVVIRLAHTLGLATIPRTQRT